MDKRGWEDKDIIYSEACPKTPAPMAAFRCQSWDMTIRQSYTDQDYAMIRQDILENCRDMGPSDFDFDAVLPRKIMRATLYGNQDYDDLTNVPWEGTLVMYSTDGDLLVIVFDYDMTAKDVAVFRRKHRPVKVEVHTKDGITTVR